MRRRELLGAAAASVALAGCGDPTATKGSHDDANVPNGYTRYVDCEANVVVYEQNKGEGGFETVPLNETNLKRENYCDE